MVSASIQDKPFDADSLSCEEDKSFPFESVPKTQQRTSRSRWQICFINVLLAVLLPVLAYATQLSSHTQYGDPRHRSAYIGNPEDYSANVPFIFDSVHSLLKEWPNTYSSNGHFIMIGSVLLNTLLYHTRPNNEP